MDPNRSKRTKMNLKKDKKDPKLGFKKGQNNQRWTKIRSNWTQIARKWTKKYFKLRYKNWTVKR